MKILVADKIAPAAIELLQADPDCELIISDPAGFHEHLAEAEGLLVRSAAKVPKEVIEKAPNLKAIGRAGIGVDNIDLEAATAAGILVMNTPGGNAVAVAEHTLALMLSMARGIPQANESTKSGKWEKKKFLGSELRSKTLGIVGLGSIGREVVQRARAFEMRIIGTDPYVSKQWAEDMNVELVPLEELLRQSDYISLHVALTPETANLLSTEQFAMMKDGVRIVNCARGGIVDEVALKVALDSGKVAGAGLDVFAVEPPEGNPVLEAGGLVATPHIGGATGEAQEIVGIRIAEQVLQYLRDGVAINAVNMPSVSPKQYKRLGPYINLAQRLGAFAAQVASGNPKTVRLVYQGEIGTGDTKLIRNGGLGGVLNSYLSQKVNVVNAMQIATERGLNIGERHEKRTGASDTIRIELETDTGMTSVEGALVLGKPRMMQIDGINCEATLAGNIMFMNNKDVPGVIGHVGTVLGNNGINIANFSLGRESEPSVPGESLHAVAAVETDGPVPEKALNELRELPAVLQARNVVLG